MKVRALKSSFCITHGEVYEVKSEDFSYYTIFDDDGDYCHVEKCYFEIIEEVAVEEQIKEMKEK